MPDRYMRIGTYVIQICTQREYIVALSQRKCGYYSLEYALYQDKTLLLACAVCVFTCVQ